MEAKRATTWANFSANIRDWFGSFDSWNPANCEKKRSFPTLRSLKFTNEEKTKVFHQNTFGTVLSDPWRISYEANVLRDGLVHPYEKTMRTLLHEDGTWAWIYLEPRKPEKFISEICSYCTPDYRLTNSFAYDTSGKLSSVGIFRECSQREPEKPFWSTDDQMKDGWQVSFPDENFTGAERIVKSNLDVEIVPDCLWDRAYWSPAGEGKENELHFLPDGVALSCPADISGRTDLHLSVCQVNDDGQEREIRQHTVYYRDGCFSSFKQGIYHQEKA